MVGLRVSKVGEFFELVPVQRRDRSVSTAHVAEFDVVCRPRIKIGQRFQGAATGPIFLGEPHLIAAQRLLARVRAEGRRVLRVEDQLRTSRVRSVVLEKFDEFRDE